MKPIPLFCGAFVFFFAATSTRASDSELSKWDVTVKTGGIVGSISAIPLQSSPDAALSAAQSYSFGGIPVEFGWNRDLSESLSLFLGGGLVADPGSFQISRTQANGELAYHLLGGSRRVIRENNAAIVISREPTNLSLLLNFGYQNYSALDKTTGASVQGSVFVIEAGLQYRFDTAEDAAWALELLQTVVPLPASAENVTPSNLSFLVNYRFYI